MWVQFPPFLFNNMRHGIHISYRTSTSIYSNFTSNTVYSRYNTNYITNSNDLYSKYLDTIKSRNLESSTNIDNKYKVKYYRSKRS